MNRKKIFWILFIIGCLGGFGFLIFYMVTKHSNIGGDNTGSGPAIAPSGPTQPHQSDNGWCGTDEQDAQYCWGICKTSEDCKRYANTKDHPTCFSTNQQCSIPIPTHSKWCVPSITPPYSTLNNFCSINWCTSQDMCEVGETCQTYPPCTDASYSPPPRHPVRNDGAFFCLSGYQAPARLKYKNYGIFGNGTYEDAYSGKTICNPKLKAMGAPQQFEYIINPYTKKLCDVENINKEIAFNVKKEKLLACGAPTNPIDVNADIKKCVGSYWDWYNGTGDDDWNYGDSDPFLWCYKNYNCGRMFQCNVPGSVTVNTKAWVTAVTDSSGHPKQTKQTFISYDVLGLRPTSDTCTAELFYAACNTTGPTGSGRFIFDCKPPPTPSATNPPIRNTAPFICYGPNMPPIRWKYQNKCIKDPSQEFEVAQVQQTFDQLYQRNELTGINNSAIRLDPSVRQVMNPTMGPPGTGESAWWYSYDWTDYGAGEVYSVDSVHPLAGSAGTWLKYDPSWNNPDKYGNEYAYYDLARRPFRKETKSTANWRIPLTNDSAYLDGGAQLYAGLPYREKSDRMTTKGYTTDSQVMNYQNNMRMIRPDNMEGPIYNLPNNHPNRHNTFPQMAWARNACIGLPYYNHYNEQPANLIDPWSSSCNSEGTNLYLGQYSMSSNREGNTSIGMPYWDKGHNFSRDQNIWWNFPARLCAESDKCGGVDGRAASLGAKVPPPGVDPYTDETKGGQYNRFLDISCPLWNASTDGSDSTVEHFFTTLPTHRMAFDMRKGQDVRGPDQPQMYYSANCLWPPNRYNITDHSTWEPPVPNMYPGNLIPEEHQWRYGSLSRDQFEDGIYSQLDAPLICSVPNPTYYPDKYADEGPGYQMLPAMDGPGFAKPGEHGNICEPDYKGGQGKCHKRAISSYKFGIGKWPYNDSAGSPELEALNPTFLDNQTMFETSSFCTSPHSEGGPLLGTDTTTGPGYYIDCNLFMPEKEYNERGILGLNQGHRIPLSHYPFVWGDKYYPSYESKETPGVWDSTKGQPSCIHSTSCLPNCDNDMGKIDDPNTLTCWDKQVTQDWASEHGQKCEHNKYGDGVKCFKDGNNTQVPMFGGATLTPNTIPPSQLRGVDGKYAIDVMNKLECKKNPAGEDPASSNWDCDGKNGTQLYSTQNYGEGNTLVYAVPGSKLWLTDNGIANAYYSAIMNRNDAERGGNGNEVFNAYQTNIPRPFVRSTWAPMVTKSQNEDVKETFQEKPTFKYPCGGPPPSFQNIPTCCPPTEVLQWGEYDDPSVSLYKITDMSSIAVGGNETDIVDRTVGWQAGPPLVPKEGGRGNAGNNDDPTKKCSELIATAESEGKVCWESVCQWGQEMNAYGTTVSPSCSPSCSPNFINYVPYKSFPPGSEELCRLKFIAENTYDPGPYNAFLVDGNSGKTPYCCRFNDAATNVNCPSTYTDLPNEDETTGIYKMLTSIKPERALNAAFNEFVEDIDDDPDIQFRRVAVQQIPAGGIFGEIPDWASDKFYKPKQTPSLRRYGFLCPNDDGTYWETLPTTIATFVPGVDGTEQCGAGNCGERLNGNICRDKWENDTESCCPSFQLKDLDNNGKTLQVNTNSFGTVDHSLSYGSLRHSPWEGDAPNKIPMSDKVANNQWINGAALLSNVIQVADEQCSYKDNEGVLCGPVVGNTGVQCPGPYSACPTVKN